MTAIPPPWLSLLLIAVMAGGLVIVPLGLPGVWVMVLVLAGATWAGAVSPTVFLAAVALAGIAELLEFVVLRRLGDRFGGSRRAFWGAVAGGLAGVVVGLPIPIVGSFAAGVLGTFAGAIVATLSERRTLREASRVGWGVLLARVFAVGLKIAIGVAVLVLGSVAILLP